MTSLEQLRRIDSWARLPAPAFHQPARIAPLQAPRWVGWSPDAARALGLDPPDGPHAGLLELLNGERPLPGPEPLAMRYAGHQFGVPVPRLGDGRAALLAEVASPAGERWEVVLKGSGPTAYARGFDGRAVLRSAIRELLASEHLDALGIPTTRALAVIGSGTPVVREGLEQGAILVRLARSHLRFGHFEALEPARVAELLEFAVAEHWPGLRGAPDRFERLYLDVVERTARLVAAWQLVGFAHGVLNTDNMSLLGLTLDYGPFGFVEAFDPAFVPNHSDEAGRYALDRQPDVAVWNLARLAEALAPHLPLARAEQLLDRFAPAFLAAYEDGARRKLGLRAWAGDRDAELFVGLLELMAAARADWTGTFRALCGHRPGQAAALRGRFPGHEAGWDAWAARWEARLAEDAADPEARAREMERASPALVLRNWMAQVAIERAERGDPSEVARLLGLLRRPFDDPPPGEPYAGPAPDWSRRLVISCSS